MRELKFKNKAFGQLGDWFEEDKKTAIRILRILRECQRTPYEGTGKPEPLKGNRQGLWSRRIDEKHRLVYEVTDELIVVCSLSGHYDG